MSFVPRATRQRPQDSHQRGGTKAAAVLAETRTEIRDRQYRTGRIGQRGLQDGGVALVGLAGGYLLEQLHAPPAPPQARVRSGQCVFRISGELRSFETMFYRRNLLPVGEVFAGPAVVLQKDSTTVIPPGCSAINDPAGNLILTIAGIGDARL